ncbi:MAG: hypothetical protein H6743_03905 [Rickettsiaceae bacterium]|nr:hypothetical protein [Rickettsiaceae bacterium]
MENPLRELLKEKNILDLVKETGITQNSLRNISRMLPEEVANVKIGTNEVLKEKLGIDMVDYFHDRSSRQENEEVN